MKYNKNIGMVIIIDTFNSFEKGLLSKYSRIIAIKLVIIRMNTNNFDFNADI